MKMIFLDSLKVKKIMKICSKTHQIAPFKKIFGEACPEPPSKRMATHITLALFSNAMCP